MIETLGWGEDVIAKYSDEGRDEILAGLQSRLFCGISLALYLGHTPQTLDRLVGLPNLKILHVQDLDIALDSLDRFPGLEQLTINETKQTLDLGRLPKLRSLRAVWHPKLLVNEAQSRVSSFHVWNYRPGVPNLEQAPRFPELACLELIQSNITSLQGIQSFPHLRRLELHYLSKLEHLTALQLDQLRVFIAHDCPKMEDHEQLGACRMLEIINVSRAGSMRSIRFIRDLPNLWTFRFLQTPIEDGDYSPLHQLEDVYFTDSRTIGYKSSDFRQGSKNLAAVLMRDHQY